MGPRHAIGDGFEQRIAFALYRLRPDNRLPFRFHNPHEVRLSFPAFTVVREPRVLVAVLSQEWIVGRLGLADTAIGLARQDAVIGAQYHRARWRCDLFNVGGNGSGLTDLDRARLALALGQRLPFFEDVLQVALVVLDPARGVEGAEPDTTRGEALQVAAGTGQPDARLAKKIPLGVFATHGHV